MREVGQGRNPAALSDFRVCALFVYFKSPLKSSFQRVYLLNFSAIGGKLGATLKTSKLKKEKVGINSRTFRRDREKYGIKKAT